MEYNINQENTTSAYHYCLRRKGDSRHMKLTRSECESSSTDSEDSERDDASQTSAGASQGKKQTLKTSPFITYKRRKTAPRDGRPGVSNRQNLNAETEDHLRYDLKLNMGNGKFLTFQAEELSDETGLIDVHMTINSDHRTKNVPFVCLTSKLDGHAVMGHPLEIEVLSDSYETSTPRNELPVVKLWDDNGRKFPPLVGKTAKRARTPVAYINYLVSGNKPGGEASKSSLAMKAQLLEKCKNQIKFRQATKENCVPVERIFSRILAEVGHV